MGGKKLKTSNGGKLSKPLGLNKSKKNKEGYSQNISMIVESDEKLPKKKEEKKKKKSSEKRRNSLEGVAIVEKKKSKLKNKKRQREKIVDAEIDEPSNETGNTEEKNEMEGEVDEKIIITKKEKKKKRKNEKIGEVNEVNNEVQQRKGKSKKARNTEKKDQISNNDEEAKVGAEEDEVCEISSGDEDLTAGMTKWVSEYHESRPGLDILQQRIDDFITDHEAKEEQARKEKEARMAEDGWTFVGAQKGRKKTADSDGVVVGSVAEAAVRDKFSKKQTKLVGPDFYRFQKREAHRNEIMKLQSKFEEDKKRIQQMRATRKFRPY